MIQCDIIIPVWNQLAHTKACIDSITVSTGQECASLIIVDNASSAETARYLASLPGTQPMPVTVIRNDVNLGFIKAANQGLAASKAACACVLNNDTIVTKGWLERMMEAAFSDDAIGIVNPSSNNLGRRPAKGQSLEALAAEVLKEEHLTVELGACIGFCMLIKREVLDKTGSFDEVYGMGNFEDTDLSRKAVKAGYRCVMACRAYVHHHENTSFSLLKTFSEEFDRNREIFEFRWGKPRRIAYVIDAISRPAFMRITRESLDMARFGDRIWFFSPLPLELPLHANIMSVVLPRKRYAVTAVFRILKKKKKYDEIFISDERLGKALRALAFIHRSKVSYY